MEVLAGMFRPEMSYVYTWFFGMLCVGSVFTFIALLSLLAKPLGSRTTKSKKTKMFFWVLLVFDILLMLPIILIEGLHALNPIFMV